MLERCEGGTLSLGGQVAEVNYADIPVPFATLGAISEAMEFVSWVVTEDFVIKVITEGLGRWVIKVYRGLHLKLGDEEGQYQEIVGRLGRVGQLCHGKNAYVRRG